MFPMGIRTHDINTIIFRDYPQQYATCVENLGIKK